MWTVSKEFRFEAAHSLPHLKDERAARLEMPILGNGKAWDNGPAKPQAKDEPQGAPQPGEVPF